MAGLDFASIGAQIAYWENHITKRFMGGWSGSGENGVDVGMPQGTPVYALTGGAVVGHGYYGGGGVVSIQEAPGRVWYYQHLDLNEPGIESGATKQVAPGQLVGWSGGQLSGGNHPSSEKFSGGPHIEVGINAPWGGIWGPKDSKGPNIDPWPSIAAIGQAGSASTTGTPAEPGVQGVPTATAGYAPWDPRAWLDALRQQFGTLFTWLTDPLRILKLIGGVLVIGIAVTLTVLSLTAKVAPDALQVAGVATGQPELVAAGRAAKSAKSAASSFAKTRRRARSPGGSAPSSNVRPQSPTADRGGETPPAQPAKTSKETPVYYGGKRVGVERDGQVIMDKKGAA
jgi:hypothetical protein